MNFFAQQERARAHTKRMLVLFVLAVACIVAALDWAGLILRNDTAPAGMARLDAPGSRAQIWVIPTDEERMIAEHTMRRLGRATPGAGPGTGL